MQSYPSIPAFNDRRHTYLIGQPCYIFYKYDGSNIRFEVNPKNREVVKVGTRTRLMDRNDPVFGAAVPYFEKYMLHELMNRVGDKLLNNAKRLVFFAEWYGENSFAGSHDPNDEKRLKLFDLHVGNHGFLSSNMFYKTFYGTPHVAELRYAGHLVPELIHEVRAGIDTLGDLTEGVVIHVSTSRGWEKVKVKTQAWLDKVRAKYGDDWERYA